MLLCKAVLAALQVELSNHVVCRGTKNAIMKGLRRFESGAEGIERILQLVDSKQQLAKLAADDGTPKGALKSLCRGC